MFGIHSTIPVVICTLCSIPVALHAQGTNARPAPAMQEAASTNGLSPLPSELAQLVRDGSYQKLQTEVLQRIKAMNQQGKDAEALLNNDAYRQLISIAEILRVTGPDQLASFNREIPYGSAFMNRFLSDRKWMELYLGAGMVPEQTDAGMKVLAEIWKKHGRNRDFNDYLPLTCGLASVWGAGPTSGDIQRAIKQGTENKSPLWRYEFFRNLQQQGKLYKGFLNLRPWELRFVVGHAWDDASYQWAAENINIPPRRYTDACNFARYIGTNFFGDTIQGPLFYMPWRDEVGQAENVKLRGGVCGSLSTIGAMAAMAHGIPAYTVGQPGHCAYGIRLERGTWLGGFGGPNGGMHNYIFGSDAPTSWLLMEKVFGDDAQIDHAYAMSYHARALEQLDEKDKAIKAWETALTYSPLHKFFRQQLHQLFNESGKIGPKEWLAYALEALPAYNGNGFAAADIFADAESKFIGQIPEKDRLAWLHDMHKAISTTPTAWSTKSAPLLDKQLSYLDTDTARQQFLGDVLTTHLNAGDGTLFGQTLEWAVKTFIESGKENIFSKAFELAASSQTGGGAGMDAKKLKDAYNKAILAAEKAQSKSAFQALTKAAVPFSRIERDKQTFTSAPLPGKLVPPTGLVRVSSTTGYDSPCEHLYMLMPCGGTSHTDKEASPNIIVELPSAVDLSGLIVTKRNDNQDRMKKMRISTSTDGATWFPLAETEKMPKEWRVESKKDVKAKWIKVEALNEHPEFMHLRHILVYQR